MKKFSVCSFFESKLLLSIIIFFIMPSSNLMAQNNDKFEIKGIVTDPNGNPIENVSVVRKNREGGTKTDASGSFKIKIQKLNTPLIFSSIGYANKEWMVKDTLFIMVKMERAIVNNEEVVVIGYGTSSRKDLTGSIASFKPKKEDEQMFNSVDQLMRGRVSGVQVVQAGGAPGEAISLKIRGVNSLRGDNEPLYVVDGIIVSNVTLDNSDPFSSKTANSGQSKQNGLTGINPQDIESIEVLKDASATAIYGSRGANGVVIITTRQGKGKPVVSYSTFIQMSKASKKLPVLDVDGYASYMNEVQQISGFNPKYGMDTLVGVNWQDEMEKTGISYNNRFSLSGTSADNKSKYFFAAGYLNNDGIIKNSYYKQGDFKLNFNQDLSTKIKFNFTISGLVGKNSMTQSTEPLGGGDNSFIMKMLVANPIKNDLLPLDDPNFPYDNPYSWLNSYDDFTDEQRVISGLGFSYKISKTFTYKVNLNGDYRNKERKRWFGKGTFVGKNANGSLGLSTFDRKFYQMESLLMFNKKINRVHDINGTFGVTYDNELITSSSVINENFFTDELGTEGFGFGQLLYPYIRNKTGAKVFSVLLRGNYSFKDKYLVTVSGRMDGSSKFAAGNKFSYFPAVSGAWRISQESFMKNIKMISDLKWRIGYGMSGNQAIDPYGTFARYGQLFYINGNILVNGAIPLNIQNDRLKWETTSQYNTGFDLSMFKNRLSFNADIYYKKTNDLLQTFTIPTSTGYQVLVKNIGSVENKGLELNLSGIILNKKQFTWNASANISFNRNKILDLGLPESLFGNNTWEAYLGPNVSTGTYFKDAANIFIVGKPVGMFYGYKTNGVYQLGDDISSVTQFGLPVKYGDLKMVDQNGDGDINPDDKVIIGNPNPDFVFGFSTGITYKNFNLNLFFNGSYGNQVVNGNLMRIGNANGSTNNNILADYYYNAWTPEKGGNLPRVGYDNVSFIDSYVEDASYLRLATTSLNYTFNIKKNKLVKSFALNLSAQNLFTITSYSGFDPDVNSFSFDKGKIGVDWGSYPNLKAVSIGANLTF